MAKKWFTVLVVATVIAGGVFAQVPLSVGAGGYIGGDFGGGVEVSANVLGTMSFETPHSGGGGFVFLDAKYAELSLGIYSGKYKMRIEGLGVSATDSDSSITNLNIGLLGKYPLGISDKFSVFPLFGIDWAIALSVKDKDGEEYKFEGSDTKSSDFSALWVKFGGGADFSLMEKLYLRLDAMYGVRFANKFEKDMKDSAESCVTEAKTLLGHGGTIKLALGYRLSLYVNSFEPVILPAQYRTCSG
jgi:hypothetical protein